MSLSEELRKLDELHRSGGLTAEEFARAKAALLGGAAPTPGQAAQDANSLAVEPDKDLSPQRLRTMQIIAGALLMGVASFFAIVLFIVHGQNGGKGVAPPPDLPLMSIVAVGMLAVNAPLAFVLPAVITRTALRRIASGTWQPGSRADPAALPTAGAKLLVVRQTTLIIGLALLEGTAFMGCMAYLLEASPLALAVAGVAVVLQLWKFPTAGRVRSWLEKQAEALAELRRQRGLAGER